MVGFRVSGLKAEVGSGGLGLGGRVSRGLNPVMVFFPHLLQIGLTLGPKPQTKIGTLEWFRESGTEFPGHSSTYPCAKT